jgi:hypothetical protein
MKNSKKKRRKKEEKSHEMGEGATGIRMNPRSQGRRSAMEARAMEARVMEMKPEERYGAGYLEERKLAPRWPAPWPQIVNLLFLLALFYVTYWIFQDRRG